MFAGFCLVAPSSAFCMVILPKAWRENRMAHLALHFWRLSLGVLYALTKAMYTRESSKRAVSRAREEGMERGNLPVSTPKPPVAQRAGGIYKCA